MSTDNSKIKQAYGFGTFKGVFLPSILTIFGVIMYLRLGWVLGNVGLTGTIVIVTISTAITFITGLSISAIATNMKVKGGGAYFMIARSLGVEAGAAVGLSLFFAKAIGISFYIAGFTESVHSLFPQVPQLIVGVASLTVLTILAYISANLALRVSLVIFIIIIASLISFFMGGPPPGGFAAESAIALKTAPFWFVFAIFFPAVTGIEGGISMSGDLKNPAKSLPWGTIVAVLMGFAVYLAIPIFLNSFVPKEDLLSNQMIFLDVSRFKIAVVLGIWGATLSSALGSLLGAPRTLQALAKDRIVPAFLGKGHGVTDNPRIATAVSFMIALAAILIGNLNSIASVLSMFFLTAYGSLNLVAGLEGLLGHPSWRPSFRTPWFVSLAGAALCLAAMLMINAGATFIAIFVVALLYYATAKRRLNPHWMDIRRGMHLALARFSIYRLIESEETARSWRPNMLVFAGSPSKRLYLIELADAITHGKGFLTVASILERAKISEEKIYELEKSIRIYLKERKIPALVEVVVADDLASGIKNLVTTYGIGPLIPNTIMLGEAENPDNYVRYASIVKTIYTARRNTVIIRERNGKSPNEQKSKKSIVCWWGGKRENAGLMLTLGYMLKMSPEWRGAELSIKTIVKDEQEREVASKMVDDYLKEARVVARPDVLVYPYDDSPLPTTIKQASQDADIVFIGMRPPDQEETPEEYVNYYSELMVRTADFPPLAIVLAAEDIKFQDIFV
ncbi:MAG: amino acid permease [Pseudomonadota bacterium]